MDEQNGQVQQSAGRPVWIWVLLALLVLGGIAVFGMRKDEVVAPSSEDAPAVSTTTSGGAAGTVQTGFDAEAITVNVEGGMFYFTPKEIRVKKGQKVKIVFFNKEGLHDWVVDEFSARTPVIKAGETSTIEFVADKAGTFEYYCSVGTHRQQGMKGNLIVVE